MSERGSAGGGGWRTNLALASISSLLVLGALELGLRLAWQNPYRGDRDHVLILRKHAPNLERRYDRRGIDPTGGKVDFRTDARSYIVPSGQQRDPEATVVFLGGSTTACVAVAEPLRFPALVSTLLAERGLRVDTLNAGHPGNNLHDSLNVFLNHVVLDRPDIAVLMHAVNDHGTLAKTGSYARSMGEPLSGRRALHWMKQALSSQLFAAGFLRQRLAGVAFVPEDLAAGVAARDAPEAARDLPIAPFRERLRAFVAMARAFDVHPVLMTQPLSGHASELTPDWADTTAQTRFNEAIREVARDEGALLIDLARHVAKTVPDWREPMRVFYDGMHVTDEGSRIYAAHISEVLAGLLRPTGGG